MESNIEERVNSLKGKPYTQDIGNHARSYSDWIVANFGHVIDSDYLRSDWNCRLYLDELAELRGMNRDQVVSDLEQTHTRYQKARSISAMHHVIQEEQSWAFTNYAAECREYLDHLIEAMDDHLGISPESVEQKDLDAMYQITGLVRKAYDRTGDYGYTHRPEEADVRWYAP